MKAGKKVFSLAALIIIGGCSFDSPQSPQSIYHGSTDPGGAPPLRLPTEEEIRQKEPNFDGLEGTDSNSVFPYFLNLDTVAFMNCPADKVSTDPVFFTFKFGAYASGLRLTSEFAEKLEGLNAAEKEEALQNADFIDSQVQISLSGTGSPAQIAQFGGSQNVVQTLRLNQKSVLKNLAERGVSYRLAHNATLEMNLPYPGNGLFNLIPLLDRQYTIYLTYNNGKNNYPLSSGSRVYYGKYFNFNFSSNVNYLEGIREYNLQDESPSGNWICPESLRFAIHRDSRGTREFYNKYQQHLVQNRLSVESECKEDSQVLSPGERALLGDVLRENIFIYGRTHKVVSGPGGGLSWVNTGKNAFVLWITGTGVTIRAPTKFRAVLSLMKRIVPEGTT